MRVIGWRGLQLCGLTPKRTTIRVTHPPGRVLDVTRLIDFDDRDESDDSMPNLAFVAMSTTGTSPDSHEIWELSVRLRRAEQHSRDVTCHWQLPVAQLQRADGSALHRLGFYDRHRGLAEPVAMDTELLSHRPVSLTEVTRQLASFLLDAHPVTLYPEHDQPFLATFLRRHGQPATWKPAVPVTAMAAGHAYGYAAGWNRHADITAELAQPQLLEQEPAPALVRRIDTSGYGPPWRPADLAREMGLPVSSFADTVSAAGRLMLTVTLWDAMIQPIEHQPTPSTSSPSRVGTAALPLIPSS
ncbi:hypothetical protein ACIBEJ_00955 [Nonomuraea sp. NPDC050790]|uniref:hypothetical protein n=1 Tax=Nonomuraea sp. NPDC050790 TaxID=3364371 RepID=UPI0037A2B18C